MRQLVLLLFTCAVAQAAVTVTQVSQADTHPHPSAMEIEVELPYGNKKARIPLVRTDAFESLPMTVVQNGVSRTFSASQVHHPSHAHYRDIQSKSVISVRHENGKRRMVGHVMHEGVSYFVEPHVNGGHRVTKNVRNHEDMVRQIDIGLQDIQSRKKRQTLTTPTTYVIELLVLIDSTVWGVFNQIYGANALTELHYYYTHVLNGIDTAYRNIGTPSISVSCIGLTISQTSADDTWMAGADLDGSNILSSMKTYAVGKGADHIAAFTRLDITGSGSSSVCGMAYLNGVCKDTRVSINEDQGLHCWGTAAHEIGHNMGSQHDSSGNTCSGGTQNVMASSSGFYNLENIANSYQFSTCSVNYMASYLASLTGASNCMTTTSGTRVTSLSSSVAEGTRLSLDQVCKAAKPNSPGKFFLTSEASSNPAVICASLYCQTEGGGGSASGGMRAPAGTPCGNKKSCNWQGHCVSDASAPAADDNCFWGDSWPNCADWKTYIENKWTSCTDNAKKGCCRSLAGLC